MPSASIKNSNPNVHGKEFKIQTLLTNQHPRLLPSRWKSPFKYGERRHQPIKTEKPSSQGLFKLLETDGEKTMHSMTVLHPVELTASNLALSVK